VSAKELTGLGHDICAGIIIAAGCYFWPGSATSRISSSRTPTHLKVASASADKKQGTTNGVNILSYEPSSRRLNLHSVGFNGCHGWSQAQGDYY
jgi:hypothetical protein